MEHLLLTVLGFSSGFIVAGGVVALMVGLGIIIRFIGISRTAKHVWLYENAIVLGTVLGTILTVFHVRFPIGVWFVVIGGLFTGIFVGGWILALAEVINVFPVFSRRIGLTKGASWIVISVAVGKTLGGLYHFYMRW